MSKQYQSPIDRIRTALSHIDAHDRAIWVRMAMAVKSELGEEGFVIWDEWSKQAKNYQIKTAKSVWKGITPAGGVTIASLFALAIQQGYRPENSHQQISKEEQAKVEARRLATHTEHAVFIGRRRQAASSRASKMWADSKGDSANHPYVQAKGIQPFGAAVLGNTLLLPLLHDETLVNLQLINTDGRKRFLAGGQVTGASLTLGSIANASTVLLCEGWATGCTLHQASALPVIVAFNAHNLVTVAKQMASTLPAEVAILICGDHDESGTGQQAAQQAAHLHPHWHWCVPTFTEEHIATYRQQYGKPPSDFNDLHQLGGLLPVSDIINVTIEHKANKVGTANRVGTITTEACNDEDVSRSPTLAPSVAGSPFSTELDNREQNSKRLRKASPFYVLEGVPGMMNGVYWQPPTEPDEENKPPLWLAAPLHIKAETRDDAQSNWGRLLVWQDNDQHVHQWACPLELLVASDTSEFRRELAKRGLVQATGQRARLKLVEYVQSHPPQSLTRLRCATRIGWHNQRYVLPDAVFGAEESESFIYQGPHHTDYAQSGTLAEWQQLVSQTAQGNSRIVFAISVAFAGPLMAMAGESGGGFHFVGTTSKGKSSTLLDPAASVWGMPDNFCKKWRSTNNGLEGLCLAKNDGLLILDELAQIAASEAGNAAYLIANGQAKARMTKEGSNRQMHTWRVMLLSAGEIDLAQHMSEAGKSAKGGQMARLPAIPADAGCQMGTLETLHGFATSQAFADALKARTRDCYGTAGPAFLSKLTTASEQNALRKDIKQDIAQVLASFDIPTDAAPEVGRVASRFALAAFAGELATRYAITGWPDGEALNAAKHCLQAWLAENGSGQSADERSLLSQIGSFIQAHGASRFPPHNTSLEDMARYTNRAGFSYRDKHGKLEYWVLSEPFKKELCKGFPPLFATRVLLKANWLEPGDKEGSKQRNTRKKRIPALGSKPVSVYILTDSVLGLDE